MRMVAAFAAVVVALVVVGVVEALTGVPLSLLLLPASCAWAAWDARRLRLHEYRTPLGALGPAGLCIACVACWLLIFPWYLAERWRIRAGVVGRLPPPEDGDTGGGAVRAGRASGTG